MQTIISDLGTYVSITVYCKDVDAARREAIRLAHEAVFADGRTAEVSVGLVGRHGGAYVDGAAATIRFA